MRKLAPLAMLLLTGLVGCGGSGGGGGGASTVDHPTFQITWPARSRDPLVHNLSSAQSVLVTLSKAGASGADVQVRIDRDATKAESYTGTYTIPQAVKKTATSMTATFYASTGETGDVVGTATSVVTFNGKSLSLGSVMVVGKVQQVSVVDPGTLTTTGGTKQLQASATDDQGAAVAVTPGSVTWTLASGTSISLSSDGVATPISAGTSTVVAKIDGVSSAAQSVTVVLPDIDEPNFKISWPERTRDGLTHSLSSALSAEVTLPAAATDGSDIVIKVNRNAADTTAHTETYAIGHPVKPTVSSLTAKFYAGADATGSLVGTASATVHPNGSELSLADIVVSGTVKSIVAINPPLLHPGDSGVQMMAEAHDANDNVVAISAGSLHWAVLNGGDHLTLTADGIATALTAGTATVKAVADGIPSANTTITIQSQDSGPTIQTIDLSSRAVVYNAASGKIWATVNADDFVYPNCLVSIDPATGAIGDKIPVGASPGYLAVSDDGKYAYVTLGQTQVRRFNLATHTVDTTFTVDEGRQYVDIQAVPGSPKSFAIATDPVQGVNLSVWDDGVRRTGTGAVGYAIHFSSPTHIYGDGYDSLFEDTLSTGQVTWTAQNALDVHGMDYSDGKIFNRDGKVFDAASRTQTMTLPQTHFLIDRVLNVDEADNRVYFVTWAPNKTKVVLSFDKSTGVEMPMFDTGFPFGGVNTVAGCGNHTAVFRVFGTGVKTTPIIVRNLP